MNTSMDNVKATQEKEDDETTQLPGFRFHPTDEELVGFYLQRKVEKKPMRIDHLIRQIDIYKHDPWDLPKTNDVKDTTEFYFFCKRGRKYRNSIRPNRVTGSGFWKATGIDKPVYSLGGSTHHCIGLKKTLVYYRGSAGKGTKTDWMMHEFRLPNTNSTSDKCTAQEAEVWTVCRIFKRNIPYKKYAGDFRELTKQTVPANRSARTSTVDFESVDTHEDYISFSNSPVIQCYDNKNSILFNHHANENDVHLHGGARMFSNSSAIGQAPSATASTSSSSYFNTDVQMEQLPYENWDELRSVVEYALDPSRL